MIGYFLNITLGEIKRFYSLGQHTYSQAMGLIKAFTLAAVFSCQLCLAQEAKIIKLPQLLEMMSEKSDKIHVINFWATWCGPCVKELPYFEKINSAAQSNLRVTLVSLDLDLDPDPAKVHKFMKARKLRSEVVMLDESNPDSWIDKIEKEWSGSLPATIIINHKTGKKIFIDRALKEGQLETYLDEIQ